MARRDGTGPLGRGPIDGKGLGFCTNTNIARCGAGLGVGLLGLGLGAVCKRGFGNGLGRGFGRGFGRGIGRNVNANQTASKTKKELLTQQKQMLETSIEAINKQLESL